jgi:hypothetical protein
MTRLRWPPIIERAKEIVENSEIMLTLRALFYRLVSEGFIPNVQSAYKRLSALTAEERRQGTFPDLEDRGRQIHRRASCASPQHALEWLTRVYRKDRIEGQPVNLYIGTEKNGMVPQLQAWFDILGVPMLGLGGYPSQTYLDEIRRHAMAEYRRTKRRPVLLLAVDFDPSGEDMVRDFDERTGHLFEIVHVALTEEQARDFGLPFDPGKEEDPWAESFRQRHGGLWQVELDALFGIAPDTLRDLFLAAMEPYRDVSTFADVLAEEDADRAELEAS